MCTFPPSDSPTGENKIKRGQKMKKNEKTQNSEFESLIKGIDFNAISEVIFKVGFDNFKQLLNDRISSRNVGDSNEK